MVGAESSAPAHRDPEWSFIPLKRATDTTPRRARVSLPEHLVGSPEEEREHSLIYWSGVSMTWADAHECLAQGLDVGLLAGQSGLVILDCDVKRYEAETGFVYDGRTATMVETKPAVTKRGVDDLRREVERLGHTMKELTTFTVQTKSGGFHLMYRQNPRFPLETKHHRDEWRVDVIAGQNNWVATAPSDGYSVVKDVPVIELPDWLAQWMQRLEDHLLPLGRRRRQKIDKLRVQVRHQSQLPGRENESLVARWIDLELEAVRLANLHGGWNDAIYQATLNLMEGGWAFDDVVAAVLEAAEPASDLERRKALDTVDSARRKHIRNVRMSVGGVGA